MTCYQCHLWFTWICPYLFSKFDENEAYVAKFVLEQLGQFKYFYILYFLVDILHLLVMLSNVSQLKFVDVITMENIVCTKMAQIRMMFVVDSCDLNIDVFHESISNYVLYDYGSHSG